MPSDRSSLPASTDAPVAEDPRATVEAPVAEDPGATVDVPVAEDPGATVDVPVAVDRSAPVARRTDLQIGRRLFHALNGIAIATAYAVLFTHAEVVHLFGIIACIIYIVDRVRVAYPEVVGRAPWVNRFFFRAEEQFRESAMIPYAIAILLTILTVPKPAALIGIYTLAIADPLSAVVGITWGRRRIVPGKSVEGSTAFLVATVVITGWVLASTVAPPRAALVGASLAIGLAGAVLEMLPLRIDDNLTIPLFVGFTTWIVCAASGIALS